jgi:hypothetical protein
MAHNGAVNAGRQKPSERLHGRIWLREKCICAKCATFHWFPFLHLVCFEPKRARIGNVRLAKISHREVPRA